MAAADLATCTDKQNKEKQKQTQKQNNLQLIENITDPSADWKGSWTFMSKTPKQKAQNETKHKFWEDYA